MARLQRAAHTVVWVNPLAGGEGYRPLVAGMAAALPYVDLFLPGHNLKALEALADALDAIPARRHAASIRSATLASRRCSSMNEDTLRAAETWRTRGDAVALATLVRSRRSAPRPLGNKLAISARGEMAGSVSGGCVEGAVFEEAQSVLAGGPSQAPLLRHRRRSRLERRSHLRRRDLGLARGVPRLAGARPSARRASRVVEGADAGRHLLVTHEGRVGGRPRRRSRRRGDLRAGQEAIDRERNATVEAPDALLFAEALVPPPRLVVVGAVDTAESLCRMAARARLADRRRRSARYVRDRRARAVGRPARGPLAGARATTSSASRPRTRWSS